MQGPSHPRPAATASRRAVIASGLATLVSSQARAQGAPPIPVRVGFIPVAGSGQLFVLEREGWARAAGLDIRTTVFESGPAMIQAFGSGTLDVYVAGVAPLAVARSRGLDVRVVAATAIEELAFVSAGKLTEAFAAAPSPAAAFAAFFAAQGRKARLATQPLGSVPNTTLQHWLWEVAKIDRAHAEIVPIGIDATQQALLAAAVDGGTLREPALTITSDRNPQVKLQATGGQMFENQPGGVVAVTGAFVKASPDAVQSLVDLVVRATDLIQKEPARAAPHIEFYLGKGLVPTSVIERALRSPASRFVADPRVITAAVARMQDFQVKIGALQSAASLEGLFDASYYERAVAKAGPTRS